MAAHIVEKNYRRFEPVGQEDICATCSAACKTSCSRKLGQELGNDVHYIVGDINSKKVEIDRFYEVTVKDVDSVPCSLKEQKLKYDVNGNLLEGELVTPWEMDWIYDVVTKYLKEDSHLSGTKKVDFFNPAEEDQLVVCEVFSYVERR
ncbi:MAG: hypothetical protein RR495_05670 [Anaerovoracaceae bacterium]